MHKLPELGGVAECEQWLIGYMIFVQVFMNNYIFKIDKYQFLSHCGTTSL